MYKSSSLVELEGLDQPLWHDDPSASSASPVGVLHRLFVDALVILMLTGVFMWCGACGCIGVVLVGPPDISFTQVPSVSAEGSAVLCFDDVGAGFLCMVDNHGRDPGSFVFFLQEDVLSFVELRQVVSVSVVVRLLRFLSSL